MKTLCLLLMILLTISINVFAAEQESDQPREPANNDVVRRGELLIASTGLNFRSGPSMTSPIIRRAKKNEVLFRLSNHHENGYIKVQLEDGKEVWVHQKYTSPIFNPQTNNTPANKIQLGWAEVTFLYNDASSEQT